MIVVADTLVLLNLCRIGQVELLVAGRFCGSRAKALNRWAASTT